MLGISHNIKPAVLYNFIKDTLCFLCIEKKNPPGL